MGRAGARLLGLPLLMAVATLTAAAPTHAKGCKPGLQTEKGITVQVFCGHARGKLELAGKTYKFGGGSCTRTSGVLSVNIGKRQIGPAAPKFSYLGVTAPPRDGTFTHNIAIGWTLIHGKSGVLESGKVTVSGNVAKGSFKGMALIGGRSAGAASGSFSCK